MSCHDYEGVMLCTTLQVSDTQKQNCDAIFFLEKGIQNTLHTTVPYGFRPGQGIIDNIIRLLPTFWISLHIGSMSSDASKCLL